MLEETGIEVVSQSHVLALNQYTKVCLICLCTNAYLIWHFRRCVFESFMAMYMMCVHVWQCLCKSELTLPQAVPLQGGNAETDAQFIFGSVTVCQWPQMHRKGRLWDTNRPWFVPTSLTLFIHSPSLSCFHTLTSLSYMVVCCLVLTFSAVPRFVIFHSFEMVWRYIIHFCMK